MTVHGYSLQSLAGDYWRAGVGLCVGAGGWLLAPSAPHVAVICGGLTALFFIFAMRTVARQGTRIEMTDDAITRSGILPTGLRWSDLDRVKLRYYSTRRNRLSGWMTLKLAAGRTAISVDSNIDGFDAIAARTARAMAENRIDADEATLANFAALGLVAPVQATPIGAAESRR